MNNVFIACGGTGAHVMRAMIRLHILGYPFGYFKGTNFPDLFLVDQDSGHGVNQDKRTPWQEVKGLIKDHPGQLDSRTDHGFRQSTTPQAVSPLPQGADKDWYDPPYRSLAIRFQHSPILPLICSQVQREIEYSKGMMGSPAVGSLLFRLKEFDLDAKGKSNNDKAYNDMLKECENKRVVVCGSGMGGTGSSVAPTLADLCHEKGSEVMAVMVHRWFRFYSEGGKYRDSEEKDQVMKENATGGLAYYGKRLADTVATVLVGVPNEGMVRREYTSDNQQPCQDSYAHVIAALAALKHFFNEEGIEKGLYGVSAENKHRLTGSVRVTGNKQNPRLSLHELAVHVAFLSNTLHVFSKVIKDTSKHTSDGGAGYLCDFFNYGFRNSPNPAICNWVNSKIPGGQEVVAEHLAEIAETYNEHLEWLYELGLDKSDYSDKAKRQGGFLTLEARCIERMKQEPLDSKLNSIANTGNTTEPQCIAEAIFRWTAEWVHYLWKNEKEFKSFRRISKGVDLGYWPDRVSSDDSGEQKTGLAPAWDDPPGNLSITNASDIDEVIKGYFDIDDVSPNSWPDPIAVAEEFEFKITNKNPLALRKLELLLIGQAQGQLELEEIEFLSKEEDGDSLSLEHLVKDLCPGLAHYRIVDRKSRKLFGFNSPMTLLCPAPDVTDEDWQGLWESLTGDLRSNWRASDWKGEAAKVKRSAAVWLKRVIPYLNENIEEAQRGWVSVLSEKWGEDNEVGSFGMGEWLPLPNNQELVPLPLYDKDSRPIPERYLHNDNAKDGKNAAEIHAGFHSIRVSDSDKSFTLVEDFHLSGGDNVCIIWKEHLTELQKQGKFFSWTRDDETDDSIWVIKELGGKPDRVNRLRVIDEDMIRIPKICIPLNQQLLHGSKRKDQNIKYPDLPLLPQYIGLVKVPPGEEHEGRPAIKHNWNGLKPGGVPKRKLGNQIVKWDLHLLGRSHSVNFLVPFKETAEAHWMVWPNFIANDESKPWKAYYLYEHSSRESLEVRPIFMNEQGIPSLPQKRPPGTSGHSRAIQFDTKTECHTGGPPVALCAYDHEIYVGIYVVRYPKNQVLVRDGSDSEVWELAIDFGTSHTVAAERDTENDDKPIDFSPEVVPNRLGMSLRISENWPQNPEVELEMLWRPTYVEGRGPEPLSLPSDLWSFRPLASVEAAEIKSTWEPMTHYAIPVVELQRPDSSSHVISGFKWKISERKLEALVAWFQERYLRMAVELFVAQMASDRARLPHTIEFTFTYPLRGIGKGRHSEIYEESIEKMLKCSQKDLGFMPKRTEKGDSYKMYSESYAARDAIGTGKEFEVKLVADLGGGTLDLSIFTSDIDKKSRFGEVADSAKLGGDLLLEVMAKDAANYLPNDDFWSRGPDDLEKWRKRFKNLRAWMRTRGSCKLFHEDHIGSSTEPVKGLKLPGFTQRDKSKASNARLLIARYFRLIADFLARSLVAYLERETKAIVRPEDREQLQLRIQLLGNGWRLWYETEDYDAIQETMVQWIEDRVKKLWNDQEEMGQWIGEWNPTLGDVDAQDSSPVKGELWAKPRGKFDPKFAPICAALERKDDQRPGDTVRSYKFPLSSVLLRHVNKADIKKDWFEPLPFNDVPDENYTLRITKFDPPLCMHKDCSRPVELISDDLMRRIRNSILDDVEKAENQLNAPIAALIWEYVFESDEFRKS